MKEEKGVLQETIAPPPGKMKIEVSVKNMEKSGVNRMTIRISLIDEIQQLMQGVCPECGSQVKEECTDYATDEWLLTCPECGYEVVFEGYK